MRIQYRYQQLTYVTRFESPMFPSPEISWTPWMDAKIGQCIGSPYDGIFGNPLEVRIVDDTGNEVEQTPPFVPAYYERKRQADGKPGGMTWCTLPPNAEYWTRRDDIKPTSD